MNKRTLVFGASIKSHRYSNIAVRKLKSLGHAVVAFGLEPGKIFGVNIDTELIPYEDIDTITMYLSPELQKEYYTYLISLQPKRVIFNPGTVNREFFSELQYNNIDFEVACTLTLLATDQY